jgi:hypothetical protein
VYCKIRSLLILVVEEGTERTVLERRIAEDEQVYRQMMYSSGRKHKRTHA